MKRIEIHKVLFPGKKPNMKEVERYIVSFIKNEYVVEETYDVIRIGSRFASEYCGSLYTKKLKGAALKAKANASSIIDKLIISATNRRWIENKDDKHINDAKLGWYRYDVFFSLPVSFAGEKSVNYYRATLIARINDEGIFLHDMVNIKKEDSKPFES